MRTRLFATLTVTPAATLAPGQTDEKKPGGPPAGMDQQAMMDAWMKAAQPGEQHKLLAKLAGSWTTTTRMSMPGQSGPEKEYEAVTVTYTRKQ